VRRNESKGSGQKSRHQGHDDDHHRKHGLIDHPQLDARMTTFIKPRVIIGALSASAVRHDARVTRSSPRKLPVNRSQCDEQAAYPHLAARNETDGHAMR
jgi:hypothetical protein